MMLNMFTSKPYIYGTGYSHVNYNVLIQCSVLHYSKYSMCL